MLLLAYLGLEWLSEVHEYMGLPVTAWNPGLGLVFAVMVRRPLAGALLLLVGMILAEVLVVRSVLDVRIISLLGLLSAATYAGCARAARTVFGLQADVVRLRDVALLLAAGGVGAVVSAALLTTTLILARSMAWTDLEATSLPLLVGDIIGIAVVAPLCLRVGGPGMAVLASARGALMLAATGVLMGGLLWLILGPASPTALAHLHVLVLPVIGLALWRGLDGACLGLALGQALLILVMHAHGYPQDAFTAAQTVMAVLSATGLLCGAIVSERDAASQAARDAQARLAEREAAAVRADRFHLATGMTAALSHEITQPITAARSLARAAELRIASSGPPDLERLRANLRGMVTQIDLAAEILTRMRAFIGRGSPERAPAAIGDVIADTLALIGPRAARHRITISVAAPPDLPQIACDRIQIQQVLMNLIGNAIDALVGAGIPGAQSADGASMRGQVSVTVGRAAEAERLIIAVRDNGPGIPDDLAPHVFDALTGGKAEGLGLGLSICALIVEAHGGRIWLDSGQPGGTEFRFSLPVEGDDARR